MRTNGSWTNRSAISEEWWPVAPFRAAITSGMRFLGGVSAANELVSTPSLADMQTVHTEENARIAGGSSDDWKTTSWEIRTASSTRFTRMLKSLAIAGGSRRSGKRAPVSTANEWMRTSQPNYWGKITMEHSNQKHPHRKAGMLLAGLVLALSATPVRADVWTFETPSENIQCTVGQGAGVQSDITCTIIERSGSFALPRPDGCASDWGHTFTMREYGRVEVLCTPTSTSRDGHSKADYGVTGEFGGFTCESSKQGLKCTNRDGNGFFLSRKVQSVLYGAGEQGSSNGFAAASSRPDDVSVPYVMNMPYGKARSVLQEQAGGLWRISIRAIWCTLRAKYSIRVISRSTRVRPSATRRASFISTTTMISIWRLPHAAKIRSWREPRFWMCGPLKPGGREHPGGCGL